MGDTQDPRPGTLKLGPNTWDPSHRWDPAPETLEPYFTWDPRLKTQTLKERPGTLMIGETGDRKLTSLVEPCTQEL